MRKADMIVAFSALLIGACNAPLEPPAVNATIADLHHPAELAWLRTETSWTKQLPDGKRQATISTAPLHYRDVDGSLKKIDLNIASVARRDLPGAAFGVEKNTFKAYFPATAGEGVVAEFFGGARVGFWRGTSIEVLDHALDPIGRIEEGAAVGAARGSRIDYKGSFQGVNERFIVKTDLVKHELDIVSREAVPRSSGATFLSFSEIVTLPEGARLFCGDRAVDEGSPCSETLDVRGEDGGFVARFGIPWYHDAAFAGPTGPRDAAGRGVYMVSPHGEGAARVSTLVPYAWLDDPARVFPLTIDPTTTGSSNADTWIFSSCPGSNGSPYQAMYAGMDGGGLFIDCDPASILRAPVRADLSAIPAGSIVSSSTFNAFLEDAWYDGGTVNYTVSRFTGSWNEAGITWSNQPGIDAVEATTGIAWTYNIWVTWNVPVMTQNWANSPGENYGLVIRHSSEGSQTSMRQFTTREAGSNVPYFSVTYTTDPTAPTFQSANVNGARYASGSDYWVRSGDTVTIDVRHFDNQSGVRLQQVDLNDGPCNSWLDHYWDTHVNNVTYSPAGCNHVTFPSPTAEEIENAGGYTTTRFTANIASGIGEQSFLVQGRAWDYSSNDSGLNNSGKSVKVDDTNPVGSSLSPSGGTVSGAVPLSVVADDARSGVKDVTFYIGNAACSGGWNLIGTGTGSGSNYSTTWDTAAYAEGTYCVRADIRDNVDRPVTVTATTLLDKNPPTITTRLINKSSVVADGVDTLNVTIGAQDALSSINFIEGGFNFDGSPDLATCQGTLPGPPCRGVFGWSPAQAFLLANGFASVAACTGGGYAGLASAWGPSYLVIAGCTATVGALTATVEFTLKLDPSWGYQTGNWVAAVASDAAGAVAGPTPITPTAPLFDVTLPGPGAPSFKPVAAYTKGLTIYLEWNAATDPYVGIKDYEVARTNTPAEAQSCGASPPGGFTSSGAVNALNYTFAGLADGQKYCHWVRARNNSLVYSSWSTPASSTQDNTAPACAVSTATGTPGIVYYNTSSKKAYYNNSATAGVINIAAAATDAASGVASVTFPAVGGFSGSGTDSAAPFQSSDAGAYAFGTGTLFTGAIFLLCNDGVNNQNVGNYSIERDVIAPDGGGLLYPTGSSSGTQITVQYDEGSDFGAGIGTIQLQRSVATYSGGVCGAFDAFGDVGSQAVGGLQWVDTSTSVNRCYRYQAVATDRVGNQVTYPGAGVYIRVPGAPTDPAKSTIAAAPASIVADGASTSTITVTAVDTNSVSMGPGQDVTISRSAGSGTLLGAVRDMGDGTYTQQLQSTAALGSGTVQATINGVQLNGSATVSYVAGPVDSDKTTVIAAPATLTADGASTAVVTVTPKDGTGNLLGAGQTVKVNLAGGTGAITGAIVDNNDGTYAQTVTAPAAAGSGDFSADVNAATVTQHAVITYVPGSASTLAFSVPPLSPVGAGTTWAALSVAVQDAHGNTITSDNASQVTLAIETGSDTLKGTFTRAVVAGVAQFNDLSYTKAETVRIRASSAPLADALSGDIVVGAAPADHVVLSARAASVLIGTNGTVDLSLKDRYGNDAAIARQIFATVDGTATIVSTSLGGATGLGTNTVIGITGPDGRADLQVTDAIVETVTVTATGKGLPAVIPHVDATIQFVLESPDHVTLSAASGSVKAGGTKDVRIQVKDKNNADLAAQAKVTITASGSGQFTATTLAGAAGLNTGAITGTVPATGAAMATVTDTKAELVAVGPTTQLPRTMPDTGASVLFVPNVPAGTVTLTAVPATLRADGASISTVTSDAIKDQHGNVQPDGTLVTVAASKGVISTVDADPATIGIQVATAAGVITFTATAGSAPGTSKVSVASVEGTAQGETSIEFVANALPTADAGADIEVVAGDAVTLDGSGSSDPDGDPLSYAWKQTAGDAVMLSDAASQAPAFTAPDVSQPAAFTFQLIVDDGFGFSPPDTVAISVLPKSSAKPAITSAPATKGTAAAPYHYDADDTAEASGHKPITWSVTAGPAGLSIDAASGLVAWVPAALGGVTITIKAQNAYGSDEQTFDVDVSKGVQPDLPVARLEADKSTGDAPLKVTFDGSGSTAGTGATIAQYRWDFGDGATASGKDDTASHSYSRAGGYRASLVAIDDWGQASARAGIDIAVTAGGKQPPKVTIVADKTEGEAPLQVSFSSDTQDDGQITAHLWDFGDGATSTIDRPAHVFPGGGSFPVSLMVTDNDGLTAADKIFIIVTQGGKKPPAVTVAASAGGGEAPLKVDFTATITVGDATVTGKQWYVDGASAGSGDALSRTFADPGRYAVSFTATDESGLTASDVVAISVTKNGLLPPQIVTDAPIAARAGIAYRYEAKAIGDQPIAWTVSGPDGLKVDEATGAVTWTPSKDSEKSVDVTLSASNKAGEDVQTWTIIVSGSGGDDGADGGAAGGGDLAADGESAGGCSCSVGGAGDRTGAFGAFGMLIGAWIALRRMHRR